MWKPKRVKVLGEEEMGFGEGEGKPFFRRVPLPFPNLITLFPSSSFSYCSSKALAKSSPLKGRRSSIFSPRPT